jgi:hypothetical protein
MFLAIYLLQATQPGGSTGETIKVAGAIIGAIGGGLGIASFIINWLWGYLEIAVEASQTDSGAVTALTSVANRSILARKIRNAVLVVSKANIHFVNASKAIARDYSGHLVQDPGRSLVDFNTDWATDQVAELKFDRVVKNKDLVIIPLAFCYDENVDIADEKLTFRCEIPVDEMDPGAYDVRFFVTDFDRLHRSTQDLIILRGKTPEAAAERPQGSGADDSVKDPSSAE